MRHRAQHGADEAYRQDCGSSTASDSWKSRESRLRSRSDDRRYCSPGGNRETISRLIYRRSVHWIPLQSQWTTGAAASVVACAGSFSTVTSEEETGCCQHSLLLSGSPYFCPLILEPDLNDTHTQPRLLRQMFPNLKRVQKSCYITSGKCGKRGRKDSLSPNTRTFRHGFGLDSKDCLKARLCAVVRMVRGLFGPLRPSCRWGPFAVADDVTGPETEAIDDDTGLFCPFVGTTEFSPSISGITLARSWIRTSPLTCVTRDVHECHFLLEVRSTEKASRSDDELIAFF